VSLEIRATSDPNRFDLHEGKGTDRIGEITCDPADPNDPTDTAPPYWEAEIWSAMGTGKKWYATAESFDEIKLGAHDVYEEFAAERRELSKGSRIWTTGSIPMGGKPGWRRR
jgi:hypothetical protein